ncbi:MAG: hypothetical protein ACI8X3_002797 [Saprospiraceae bacterium]|jgi:hypothetical protein
MIPQFEKLSEDQKELMYDAIPLITIYIAGADGKIDPEEAAWAEKLTKIRSYAHHESLQEYYSNLGETYSDRMNKYIGVLPTDIAARTEAIGEKLAGLNSVLPMLEVNFAARYYKGLLSFAKHVAKASGGFFGFGSISSDEERLMKLDVITPVDFEEDHEEGNEA